MDMFEQEIIAMMKEMKSELQLIKSMLTPAPEAQASTTIGGEGKSKGKKQKPKETPMEQAKPTPEIALPTVDVEPPPIPLSLPERLVKTWAGMGMTVSIENALEKKNINAIMQTNAEAGVLAFIYGLNKVSPDMDELSKALTAFFSTLYRNLALSLFESRQKGTFTLENAVQAWEKESGRELAL